MAPPIDAEALLSSLETVECSIGTEAFDSGHPPIMIEGCRHIFGGQCLKQWVTSENRTHDKCSICRHPLFGDSTGTPPGFRQQAVPQPQLQPPSRSRVSSTQILRTPAVNGNRTLAQSLGNQAPLRRNLVGSMLSRVPDYSNFILGFLRLNGTLERIPNPRVGNRLQRNTGLQPAHGDGNWLSRIRQRISQSTAGEARLARLSGNRGRRGAIANSNAPVRTRRADKARRDRNPGDRDGRVARRSNRRPGERRTHRASFSFPI